MSEKGEAEGFIAVYPQGSGGIAGKLRTWNAGTCCGYAMQQRIDEIAFVAALLDDLQATVAIDRARVYATGISNGGMMAYEVACALADRIAGDRRRRRRDDRARSLPADATGAGARHPRQRDRNLPLDGGVGAKAFAVHEVRSVASAVDFWRRHDGCGESARSERRRRRAAHELFVVQRRQRGRARHDRGRRPFVAGRRSPRALPRPAVDGARRDRRDLALLRAPLARRRASRINGNGACRIRACSTGDRHDQTRRRTCATPSIRKQFAFPKERKEPLENATHVRNAIARFNQVEGVSDAERDAAWKRIKAAAKKFGVEVSEKSWREIGKR